MNNVTHEQSAHALPSRHNAGNEEPVTPANRPSGNEKANLSEVLSRLDEVKFSPRAATIRAIMRYAHQKDEALH